MDKPTAKPPRRLQGKIVARLCNKLLEGSGLVVRDWQLPGTDPLPKHRRFTLETLDGDDWDEIPCIPSTITDRGAIPIHQLRAAGRANPAPDCGLPRTSEQFRYAPVN